MWYQNISSMFFCFVTKHACDRQTNGQNYDPQDNASTAALRGHKMVNCKVLPYSLPSVRPGADPGVQAVRGDLLSHLPSVGYHYFPPGLWSPSQPKNVTVLRPVPSHTAWWQRNIDVRNFSKVVTQLCPSAQVDTEPYWSHVQLLNATHQYVTKYTTVPTYHATDDLRLDLSKLW